MAVNSPNSSSPPKRHWQVLGRFLVLLLGLQMCGSVAALEVSSSYYQLDTEFEYLEDPSGELTLEVLLNEPDSHTFTSSKNSTPAASFDVVWLKLRLRFDESVRDKNYVLRARVENLYDIRVYRPDENGGYLEWITGNRYPASSRELDTLSYAFAIPATAKPITLYLRYVGGPGTNRLPWDLSEGFAYSSNSQAYYSLATACFAAIGALFFFNLIIAMSIRRASYIFYSAFVLSVSMSLLTSEGIGFYYLWPDLPQLNERATHSLNLVSAAMRLLAIVSFLGIAKEAPRWHVASMAVLALLGISFIAVNLVGISSLPAYAATLPWALGIFAGFVICGIAIKRRLPLAPSLLFTMSIPTVFAVLEGLLSVYGGQTGVFQLQAAKIGFAIHVMLFSLCLAAQLKHQTESTRVALHDKLTGLPQSVLLNERFEWAANLSKRKSWSMALLFIDLDNFKQVNDTLGHEAGDSLLLQATGRMEGGLRKTDFLARIGGDEFVLLLLDSPETMSVSTVAKKLTQLISQPYRIDGQLARISASIGIAFHEGEEQDLATLMKNADSAMYQAKRSGKNAYHVHASSPGLNLVTGEFALAKV